MDKPGFSEGNDLVSSLPKDWLNLRPPSPSFTPFAPSGVDYSVDVQDTQNLLASFDTHDEYGYPSGPPMIMYGELSHMTSSYYPVENSTLQNDLSFLWHCPPATQDFYKISSSSALNDTLGSIKKNGLLVEGQADCFHMPQWPEVTKTSDNLPFEGIFGLTLSTGNGFDISNSNPSFTGQERKLPSTVFAQDDHFSAGNGYYKHMDESHQVAIEDISLNFQEEQLHQDVDSDESYPIVDEYKYFNECSQVRMEPAVHGFPLKGSSESSMMVTGVDHLYWGFADPSYNNFTSRYKQENFEAKNKVPCYQLQASVQFSVSSSEGTGDDLCSPVQDDFSLNDNSFFPVGDSMTGDCFLPRSNVSSYPLHENIGSVSVPQVTGGLIGGENISLQGKDDCSPCKIHGTTSHDQCSQTGSVGWWTQNFFDEKVSQASNPGLEHDLCTSFGYSQKMRASEKIREDYMSDARKFMATQSSAANSKHCSMNPEPKKCLSDHLDSVIDCHTLVDNIQNSSLLLVASHSSESNGLAEPDVESLLSVIHNLSKFLTGRSGISASCIQAASQPDKAHFGGGSSIIQKVSKLAECYYGENSAADHEPQVSNLSDICFTLRSSHIVEDASHKTDFFAESDQLQGTYCKKMGKFSDLGKEKELERALSDLQDLVDKLREDLEFELKERDTAIFLYKNLWSEAQATLSTLKSEMEQINTEVKALKLKQSNSDAHVLDVGGETYLKINLNPKENVMDQAAMHQGKDHKEPDMNTSMISPMDIMSEVHDERAFQERAAILLSREGNLRERETSEIKDKIISKCPVEVDLNPKRNVTDQAAILPGCKLFFEESQTKTHMSSLNKVTSQVHCEDSFWERAAILFSREESLGKYDISRNEYNSDRCTLEVTTEIDTLQREEIISRFKALQEYKQSDMVVKNSWKQIGEAVFDEPASWNNHLEEIVADESNPEICESSQVHNQAIEGEGTFWEWANLLPHGISFRESETSEIRGRASTECFPNVDLNLKVNVTDRAAILLSHQNICENPESKKNLNCLVNVAPHADDEGSIWKLPAVLFSQEASPGESDRCRNLITCGHDRMEREEILCRFKVLHECSRNSDMTERDSEKQFGEASVQEPDSCNYSHVEENVSDDLDSESCKSNQGHNQSIEGGRLASQNLYPVTDKVQARLAVLYRREASGGKEEDDQTIVISNNFEKQASCTLASEDIHDIVNSAYDTEFFSISHLGPKSHMTFGMDQFLVFVPATESSSEENTLIGNVSMLSRLEPFHSVPVPDVSVGSQSIYFDHEIHRQNAKCDSNLGELSDAFYATEYSGTARKCDNVFTMDDLSQILSVSSSSIPKLDSDERDTIGMQNQNYINSSRGSTDPECLNQKELGCISQFQHDDGQDTFSSVVESSSIDSESSWEYVEKEEDIAFQC